MQRNIEPQCHIFPSIQFSHTQLYR